jgi:hypothetical protein
MYNIKQHLTYLYIATAARYIIYIINKTLNCEQYLEALHQL